jgi:RNA polymerase sigma factor (sigma-70 family)
MSGTEAASSLETFVVAAARGDRDAFARLVDATSGMVSSISLAILRDLESSRDVSQEVFLAAWSDLHRLRNPASFLPWLRQTTRNRANDALRTMLRRRRTVQSGEDEMLAAVADPRPDVAAALVDGEQRRLLAQAVEALPDETREIVVLFYREERSVKQVANLLEMSEDSVRQRLSRARGALRETVLERMGETLTRTAPGAAFTAFILGLISTAAPPTAAAAGLAAGAKAGSTFAKLAWLWSGAALGAIVGMLPFVYNYRQAIRVARDEPERRAWLRLAVTGCVLVLCFATSTAFAPKGTLGSVVFCGAFIACLGVMQWVWVPRIVARRHAAELLEDPTAAARHRRQRVWAVVGLLAGTLCSFVPLLWIYLTRGGPR